MENGDAHSSGVVIVSACRTAIGKLNGALSSLPAHKLGAIVISEALKRCQVRPEEVDEVILGQVLTAGQGQNPARQAALQAGLPVSVPAWNVQMVCGSGMKAVVSGMQSILTGDAKIIVAGGQESMSQAPHVVHLRNPVTMGDAIMRDTATSDGLTDAFVPGCLMGVTAENVSSQWKISREEQDEYACDSQKKAGQAQSQGFFQREIVPVPIQGKKEATMVVLDEFVKPDTSVQGLSKLRTVFKPNGGTVTPGNSSGVNDGAAVTVLMSEDEARRRGVAVLARIISWAQAAIEPSIMGVGPVHAVKKALSKAGWKADDVDLWELNEAFAATSIAVVRELGLSSEKVNISGGSIALGHPIGASGCRVLVTLLHALHRTGKAKGVAALCIGGGMGIAICVERK